MGLYRTFWIFMELHGEESRNVGRICLSISLLTFFSFVKKRFWEFSYILKVTSQQGALGIQYFNCTLSVVHDFSLAMYKTKVLEFFSSRKKIGNHFGLKSAKTIWAEHKTMLSDQPYFETGHIFAIAGPDWPTQLSSTQLQLVSWGHEVAL